MRLSKEEWKFWAVVALLVSALIVLCALLVWASNRSAIEWKMYVDANDCKVVATTSSTIIPTVTTGLDGNGNVKSGTSTTIVPGTTTWLCKDGQRHTRSQ